MAYRPHTGSRSPAVGGRYRSGRTSGAQHPGQRQLSRVAPGPGRRLLWPRSLSTVLPWRAGWCRVTAVSRGRPRSVRYSQSSAAGGEAARCIRSAPRRGRLRAIEVSACFLSREAQGANPLQGAIITSGLAQVAQGIPARMARESVTYASHLRVAVHCINIHGLLSFLPPWPRKSRCPARF